MQNRAMTERGGKSIDGTGRPPVESSIRASGAGRLAGIGTSGEFPVLPDAEIIDAFEKTALAGFIEGDCRLAKFQDAAFVPRGKSGKLELLSVVDATLVAKLRKVGTPPRGGGNRFPAEDWTFQRVVVSQ